MCRISEREYDVRMFILREASGNCKQGDDLFLIGRSAGLPLVNNYGR